MLGEISSGSLEEWQRQEIAYATFLQEADPRLGHSTMTEDTPVNAITPDAEHFHWSHLIPRIHNRRFVVFGRGLWGLAPAIVRTGDVCCIVSGTRTPFLLRKTDRENHYKILGAVYMLSSNVAPDGPQAGVLFRLGEDECHDDWIGWGLQEENIIIC